MDRLEEFYGEPTAERYELLLKEQVSVPGYNAHEDYIELRSLVREGDTRKAQKLIDQFLPLYPLSPRLHLLASTNAEKSGDSELTQLEQERGFACLDAILATGDGSEARPYLSSKVSDEYDILFIVRQESVEEQRLEFRGDRIFDRILCESGAEVWFDITHWYGKY